MMFRLDDGIPIPQKVGPGANRKYPLTIMKVGQSFFVPKRRPDQLSGSIHYAQQVRKGLKFVKRVMGGGTRIWRVK